MPTPQGKENKPRGAPRMRAGLAAVLIVAVLLALVWAQFRGGFTPNTKLTMLAARAGLVMDPGSKVTYNGVEIGRVSPISEITRDGRPAAKLLLDVTPKC